MELLLSKGATLNDAIFYASKKGHVEAVQWVIDQGSDPNMKGENNETALNDAVFLGGLDTVKVRMQNISKSSNKLLNAF